MTTYSLNTANYTEDQSLSDVDTRQLFTHAFHFLWSRRFVRFLVFSGTAAMANIAVGYLLYATLGLHTGWRYGMSVALAFLVGMGVSFALNRRYTFVSSGRRIRAEMRTFFVVSLGGLLLTVTLASTFRDLLFPRLLAAFSLEEIGHAGVNIEMLSHVCAVGLVACYSYLSHKHLSFGNGIRHHLRFFTSRLR